jgi:uncharacterized protein YqgQ
MYSPEKEKLEHELREVIPASQELRDLKRDLAIRYLQGARSVFGFASQYYTDDSIVAAVQHFGKIFSLRMTQEKNYADLQVGVRVGFTDPGYVKRSAVETAEHGGLYYRDSRSDHYAFIDDEIERIYVNDLRGKKTDVVLDKKVLLDTYQPTVVLKQGKYGDYGYKKEFAPELVFAHSYYDGFIEWVYKHAGSILLEFAKGLKESQEA